MLNYQVVGSWLLQGINGVRQPTSFSDYDIICTEEEFLHRKKSFYSDCEIVEGGHPIRKSYYIKLHDGVHEVEIAKEGSVAESLLRILTINEVSNIDLAYTLKMSHRFLRNSPHFEKTWKDEWIGEYSTPVTDPLTTDRDPNTSH